MLKFTHQLRFSFQLFFRKGISSIRTNSFNRNSSIKTQLLCRIDLPKPMHPEVGVLVNEKADSESRELAAEEIYETFKAEFLEKNAPLRLVSYETNKIAGDGDEVTCLATIEVDGETRQIEGQGNGPINAFVHALENEGLKDFKLTDYRQHSIGGGSATESAAFVQLQTKAGRVAYGCGIDSSIEKSGLLALVSAFNRTR